ncbi:MFS transporter [Candidatus Protochlamydia amoebophila]|uniref:Putative hexose phosphate transport protein n=1 Tax=Candidatus Protochlamydia amoebophila TaxID=362787 RepID=A0A0C1K1M9_9BACT|nr:MFS transporter [Candidatus Protochlamydia amoebophila]KIC73317.1 putative hexose phosphate transport protein [Candidatus Protochlamydia amoebophila]
MNKLLNLLQPAPHIPELKDQELVKDQYKYWRIRILYSMFIGYAFYYFTRKSFTFAMPGLIQDLGFDKSQLGILGSILSITYGVSKFASGIIGDRTNSRYMMAIGLMLTGICNICFGLSSSIFFFALFWGLNGWFQGFGWPPCARFLTQWYSHSERGSWWSTWNVSHNVGGFLIPWIAGITLQYFGWRYAMYIPGILCILIGFFLINRLRDTPQSLGLPPIEKYRNDYVDKAEADKEAEQLTTKQLLVNFVLKNSYIWILAFAYFFVYAVRTGINDWTALFLVESKGYSSIGANGCVSLFEVGGFFGSLAAGWSSDKLFGAKRGPINVLFTLGMFAFIAIFWMIPSGYLLFDSVLMFCIGFSIFGPQMMIGLAAAELSHKKAVATSTGFVGFFAYIGAAFAGYPLGYITQQWGWQGFYWALMGCCIIALFLLIPLWSVSATTLKPKNKSSSPVSSPALASK